IMFGIMSCQCNLRGAMNFGDLIRVAMRGKVEPLWGFLEFAQNDAAHSGAAVESDGAKKTQGHPGAARCRLLERLPDALQDLIGWCCHSSMLSHLYMPAPLHEQERSHRGLRTKFRPGVVESDRAQPDHKRKSRLSVHRRRFVQRMPRAPCARSLGYQRL